MAALLTRCKNELHTERDIWGDAVVLHTERDIWGDAVVLRVNHQVCNDPHSPSNK